MGYALLWLLITIPYIIMFIYFGFIYDFLDKYNHKKVRKAFIFNIRYYYFIYYNKSIDYNLFNLNKRNRKIKTTNISIRSFYFQLVNYIYLIISFVIMFLRCILINNSFIKMLFKITNIINIAIFIFLAIYFIILKEKVLTTRS